MTDDTLPRSSRPEVRNPLSLLPSVGRFAELPEDSRAALHAALLDLRADARAKCEAHLKRRKVFTSAYFHAVGVYALHFSKLVRPRAAARLY